MKKSYFFKFFVFALVGALVLLPSCKDYDDDISGLETELSTLKSTVLTEAELNNVKTQLESSINQTKTELAAVKAKADASLSKAELDAAMALVVKLETYNAYKAIVDADLAKLKADVAKAATKEEVDAIKATLESSINQVKDEYGARLANLEALLMVNDGKSEVLDQIQLDLTEQLAMIEANAAEIAAVNEDLQAKYMELKALIEANKHDIEVLDSKVEAYKSELDAKIANLELELTAMIVDVYQSLDHRVYTLTFIPDYTSEDGTPQIVVRGLTEWMYRKPANYGFYTPDWESDWDENWSVKEEGKIYKGITILRYNVSPTNVTMSDFEIHALLHKTSLLRYAETKSAPIMLTQHATLEDGVLSVPVMVAENDYDLLDEEWGSGYAVANNNELRSTKWGTNVSVALQVKNINVEMDNEEDRYVTSTEYVKANFDLSDGRIALNEKSLKDDGDLLPVGIEYTDIASASYASDISLWNGKSQSGNMTDVLNHTINLNDYVYAMFDDYYGDWEKLTDFGFNAHTFKFRRVYLESEGVNQSNDYVTLNETTGVIGVVPAGQTVNMAAVGRTPIVEVTALVNGKVHAVGYIKIVITDNFDATDVEFTFTLEDYILGCDSEYKLTNVDIDAIDFDKVFNHSRIQLGKDAFFAEYSQTNLVAADIWTVTPTTPVTATAGIWGSGSDVEFRYAINPATQSVNLFNYLEGTIANDAPVGDYIVKTRLRSNGFRPDVVITWKFKVKLPTNLKLTPNTVFLSNGIYKVEPTVLFQVPTPKTSTPYEGLLQNAFLHNNLDLNFGVLDENQNCDDYLTPYFVVTGVPSGFHISTVGTQWGHATQVLRNGDNALAATIYNHTAAPANGFLTGGWYVVLNDQTIAGSQIGNYVPYTAAQQLVEAGWIDVQPRGYLNGQVLNHVALHESFKVMFTKPLSLNFADKYEVWDQGTGANQRVTINLVRTGMGMPFNPWVNNSVIKDFLGNDIVFSSTFGTGANSGVNHRALVDHYEIERIVSGGTYIPTFDFDFNDVTTNLPGGQMPFGMYVKADNTSTGTAPNYTTLVVAWENATGGSVQNAFEIYLPVSIDHKWGTLEGKITIVVNPGTGEN